MTAPSRRGIAAALLLASSLLACAPDKPADQASASTSASSAPAMAGHEGMASMDAPVNIPKGALYTAADVHFMQGMIAHHAQAIFMSKLAAAQGADPRVLKFANKIDQSQMSEIKLMQEWLIANGQTAPDTSSYHNMMMAGMLTPEQITRLKASRGAEFDKNFLTMMIQHHEGALKMVEDLLASPLAAQDVDVSVFANDVTTVQTAEIGTMRRMLEQQSNQP